MYCVSTISHGQHKTSTGLQLKPTPTPEKLGRGVWPTSHAKTLPHLWLKSAIFPTLFMIWGPFLESPGKPFLVHLYLKTEVYDALRLRTVEIQTTVTWLRQYFQVSFLGVCLNSYKWIDCNQFKRPAKFSYQRNFDFFAFNFEGEI